MGGIQQNILDAVYRTENPRVGGSIPPLATINLLIYRSFLPRATPLTL
jgi:hypothetical protein